MILLIFLIFLNFANGLPDHSDKVCYRNIGCFDTGAPYSYLPERPMPPPADPIDLKPYLRLFYDKADSKKYWEIPLSGDFNISMSVRSKFDYEWSAPQDDRPKLGNDTIISIVIGCNEDETDAINILANTLGKQKFLFENENENYSFVWGLAFGTHVQPESEMEKISNQRSLAVLLANFIKHLQVEHDVNTSEGLWLIGIGCGAHMAGHVGKSVVVQRITALDPSGYMFEGQNPAVRLDRSDADFVDVIHTDARPNIGGQLRRHGYMQPIGHLDFYVNGGFRQPKCSKFSRKKETCNHLTAVDYLKATLPSEQDLRKPCTFWGHDIDMDNYIQSVSNNNKASGVRQALVLLRQQCNMTICAPMGYTASTSPLRGIKVVTTNGLKCSRTDDPVTDASDFRKAETIRLMHSFIPLEKYTSPETSVFPPVPTRCYIDDSLGCFNMSSPWTVIKSRPISTPDSPRLQSIEAWFFSRRNMHDSHKMKLFPQIPIEEKVNFNPDKMTFLLIHGFFNDGNEPWLGEMKNALLDASDCNVIVCNWGGGSMTLDYLQAAGNLRLASRVYSNLLQLFIDHKGLNVTRVHLIGHSLGSHIAGLIGKSIPGIFQITALDPAQPWFKAADDSVRITKNDASFVVGVHSDVPPFIPDLGFGLSGGVGHIDFYINGGFKQPKCAEPHNLQPMLAPNFTNILDLMKPVSQLFVQIVLCPHQSAVEIFTEAIASRHCIFWGQAIKMSNMIASSLRTSEDTVTPLEYKAATDEKCNPKTCSPLGLDTYFWPARGSFVIITKNFPPYCIFESHVSTLQRFNLGIPLNIPDFLTIGKLSVATGGGLFFNHLRSSARFLRLLISYIISKTLPWPIIYLTLGIREIITLMLPIQTSFHYGYNLIEKSYIFVKAAVSEISTKIIKFLYKNVYRRTIFNFCYNSHPDDSTQRRLCYIDIRQFLTKVKKIIFFAA